MLFNKPRLLRQLLISGLLLLSHMSDSKELVVISDIYCPYICKGKPGEQGFITEVTREAFQASNIDITFSEIPWLRATAFFTSGGQPITKYHGLLLTNSDYSPQAILNQTPLVSLKTCFYRRSDFSWRYQGHLSKAVRLGLIQGYGDYTELKALIKNISETHPVHNIIDNNPSINSLRRLLGKRFDIAVMDSNVANYLIHTNNWQDQIKPAGCTNRIESTYIGFPPDDNASKNYAKLLDKGLNIMQKNGRIQYWREKYQIHSE